MVMMVVQEETVVMVVLEVIEEMRRLNKNKIQQILFM